jgi:CRP-like cAMP-binding protein
VPDQQAALAWLPDAIRAKAPRRALNTGEHLFRQGDKAAAIYWVEAGRLELVRHTVDDHPVTLHTAKAGELFAEAALYSEVYHCDAIARTASRVRVLAKRTLRAALREDPGLAERTMAVLAREIQRLRSRLELRNIRSARLRLMHHLALAAEPGTRMVRLDGTLKDLAAELGLTHEVLYRTLGNLERERVVARGRATITLGKRFAL